MNPEGYPADPTGSHSKLVHAVVREKDGREQEESWLTEGELEKEGLELDERARGVKGRLVEKGSFEPRRSPMMKLLA